MRAGPALDPTPLARPTAVVRNRRDVADRGDGEADALQGAQRRLATRARAAHLDLERLHAMLHRLPAGVLGRDLGGEGGRFARSLEALAAGRGPGDRVALGIGDGDHGVVERGGDMGDAGRDVLALAPAQTGSRFLGHGTTSSPSSYRRSDGPAPCGSGHWYGSAARAPAGPGDGAAPDSSPDPSGA